MDAVITWCPMGCVRLVDIARELLPSLTHNDLQRSWNYIIIAIAHRRIYLHTTCLCFQLVLDYIDSSPQIRYFIRKVLTCDVFTILRKSITLVEGDPNTRAYFNSYESTTNAFENQKQMKHTRMVSQFCNNIDIKCMLLVVLVDLFLVVLSTLQACSDR